MSANVGFIMREYGKEYLRKNKGNIVYQQIKALKSISECQTGNLGLGIYSCDTCKRFQILKASCGNRHCPGCQGWRTFDWAKRQEEKNLSIEYFFMTFTVPEELRFLIYKHQRKMYPAMFKISANIIKTMMGDSKHLGAKTTGFTSVLHTWGGMLQFHPHIHVLLPGGGLDQHGKWVGFKRGFGLAVKAASKLWRGKLLAELERIAGRSNLPESIASKSFNVYCKSAGTGNQVVKYLSRYIFRVGISNNRILKVENRKVTFKYKDKETKKTKVTSLDVLKFIDRFLKHVLPSGLVKVRHYGFHHPNSKIDKDFLKERIQQNHQAYIESKTVETPDSSMKGKASFKGPKCRHCDGKLTLKVSYRMVRVEYSNTG
ncbi:MAG: transposase [Planctomycetes bacterium]|nr:transposase [Planctomycetota bacterium]